MKQSTKKALAIINFEAIAIKTDHKKQLYLLKDEKGQVMESTIISTHPFWTEDAIISNYLINLI